MSSAQKRLGIQALKISGHKVAIFADQDIVKPDFAAAPIRTLDQDHVPMHLTAVAVIGGFVGVSGSEVEAAGYFLIEKNIFQRIQDVRVESDGKLPDIARAGVGIEDFVEPGGVGG